MIGDDESYRISLGIEINSKDLDNAKTYEEAVSSPNARYFKDGMDDEFSSQTEGVLLF